MVKLILWKSRKACNGSRGIDPPILSLTIRWRYIFYLASFPIYRRSENRGKTINKKLVGPQSRSGLFGTQKTELNWCFRAFSLVSIPITKFQLFFRHCLNEVYLGLAHGRFTANSYRTALHMYRTWSDKRTRQLISAARDLHLLPNIRAIYGIHLHPQPPSTYCVAF